MAAEENLMPPGARRLTEAVIREFEPNVLARAVARTMKVLHLRNEWSEHVLSNAVLARACRRILREFGQNAPESGTADGPD